MLSVCLSVCPCFPLPLSLPHPVLNPSARSSPPPVAKQGGINMALIELPGYSIVRSRHGPSAMIRSWLPWWKSAPGPQAGLSEPVLNGQAAPMYSWHSGPCLAGSSIRPPKQLQFPSHLGAFRCQVLCQVLPTMFSLINEHL